ncbi:hypothetical protein L6452_14164 [Arctium lappa]|uniref:Uncharacterized protein n=1 Tax=Arctium lappa TaxID=4217 RepID=A0ACB9CKA8_ARCLA|nr:hypothetical protein L6452_14164 [Arctium lappa]
MKLTFLYLNLIIFATVHAHLYTVPAVIHDTAGDNLHRGIPYYILPLLHGSGGGLILSGNTTDSCPMINTITQEPFEINAGIPFTFNPIVLDETLIRTSYPTSIESTVVNPCGGSNIWKVSTAKSDINEGVAGFQIVTTGGEMNTPESCFQIVEVEMMPELRSYQIQHCPFKCGLSRSDVNCYNVGVRLDAGGKRCIGLSNAIFPVVFVVSVVTPKFMK